MRRVILTILGAVAGLTLAVALIASTQTPRILDARSGGLPVSPPPTIGPDTTLMPGLYPGGFRDGP